MSAITPETIDLSKYIELRDDRSHICGRRLPAMFVAAVEKANQFSVANLAY